MRARRIPAVVIPALALVFLLAAVHVYISVRAELTDAAIARRLAVAQLAATTQSERLQRMADLAVSLATRVRFAEQVAAGEWQAAIRILRAVPEEFSYVDRIFLADVRGALMADLPALPGAAAENFAQTDWFSAVSRARRPYVSGAHIRAGEPRREVIAVAAPIIIPGAQPAGILVLEVKPDRFFDWARGIALGEGGKLVILDSREAVAYDSGNAGGAGRVSAAHPVGARLDKGQSGVHLERDAHGTEHLYAFVPASHGWGVVVQQVAASAFAARDNQLRRLLVGYAIIALLCGGALLFVARHRRATERRLSERLRLLHEVDRAVLARQPAEAIAAAVIRPLRELLGVPRAIVNRFDLEAGEAEWVAAAGRRRTRVGGGIRYPIRLMGDLDGMRRGDVQKIDVTALPPGPEKDALLASGVRIYLVVPMITGGELIGAISFGGDAEDFPAEQVHIAQEIAAQLAIATTQARLLESVQRQASELERRVEERTAALNVVNHELRLLHEATLEISKAPDSTIALTVLLEKVCEFTRWAIGQSWLPDADGKRLMLGIAWTRTLPGLEEFRRANEALAVAPAESGLVRVWKEKQPEWQWDLQPGPQRRRALVVAAGLRSWIGFPVLAGSEVVAVVEFFDTESRPRDESILQLIAVLARQIGPVILAKRAAEQIRHLNAELQATNRELEAFSYSVSHDLRAPLRAIDGYARMLEEDYGGAIDAEGRRLLGVVRASSLKMGQLIDDLLAFSRLGRQEPAKRPVDMTDLVREVVGESTVVNGAVVDLAALPPATADRSLMKQVWANLVGNALKYSSKSAAPRVEIGGREENGEARYWVRDNGVGFDMRYAAKLFGVFQRLHRAEEFAGTGVGLAIVQRIVTRHGGRVWAEGQPGKGACFYFALPR